jgi:hypothetical protein
MPPASSLEVEKAFEVFPDRAATEVVWRGDLGSSGAMPGVLLGKNDFRNLCRRRTKNR